MATVGVQLDLAQGSGSTFLLYLYNQGTLINAGGDTLTEVSNGYFTTTVTESLTNTISYEVRVTKDGAIFYTGWLLPGRSLTVDNPGTGQSLMVGAGSVELPITITKDGDPVDGAEVWITTDEAGTNVIAGTLSTDAMGNTSNFMLDPGTYYVWVQKSGVNFTNPTETEVS